MTRPGRTFLVECYLPGITEAGVAAAGERARLAAEELSGAGREIAYVGALFVAADEAVFHQFRASDAAAVVDASRVAGLAFERVVESIGIRSHGTPIASGDAPLTPAPSVSNGEVIR